MNQDGINQEGELFTLEELNIQSLNVDYQDVNQHLGNGNTIAQKGSYTTENGETREWAKTDPRYGGNIRFAVPFFIKTAGEGRALTPSQANAAMLYLPSKAHQEMAEQTLHKIAALDAFFGRKIQYHLCFFRQRCAEIL